MAGTTFLIQLLTMLGLDTGFPDHNSDVLSNCCAGMESELGSANAPYIVKSPWLCDHLNEILNHRDIVIDHAFIPIRDLYAAAENRRVVERNSDPALYNGHISGGLWGTQKPEEQETVLEHKLYKLIYTLAKHDIDTTLLYFPKIVYEPDYLYNKIAACLLQGVDYYSFLTAFQKVARPELVSNFK